MDVSVLGFGGAEIGFNNTAQSDVDRLLGAAIDAGLNILDTAECYKDSEAKIGRAVKDRREEIYIFTKCGHNAGVLEGAEDWDPKMLEMSIDRSLRNLQTDHVDLVQLHTCSSDVLLNGDVVEVLQKAKDQGKTRFIGYSGDGQNAVTALNLEVFDAFQTSVNIADQECISLTLPLAKKYGLGVIAKRPVANAIWRRADEPVGDYGHSLWLRLQELSYSFLRSSEDIETALRFTLAQDIHTAIVGTQKPGRWQENAELADLGPLPEDKVREIRTRWAEVAQPTWDGQS